MLPNYRGLLAIIPPAVLRALTSQSAVLRFSRAAILAGRAAACLMCGVLCMCWTPPIEKLQTGVEFPMVLPC